MVMLLFLLAFLNQAYASADTSFHFPFFTTESCKNGNLICMGSVTSGDGFLSLTQEPTQGGNASVPLNQVGRVLYRYPVTAWPANISTTFTFRIIPTPHIPTAEGMAFIMAPDDGPPPRFSQGSSLGIMDESSEDNVQQLAVELDTFKDIGDIDGNHVAIDTKSVLFSLTAKSLNDIRVNLKSGRNIKVRVDYNSCTNLLEVYAAYASNPLVKVIKLQIDLEATVPSSIFVGFTASTGSFTERHQLLDWKFTSTVKM